MELKILILKIKLGLIKPPPTLRLSRIDSESLQALQDVGVVVIIK